MNKNYGRLTGATTVKETIDAYVRAYPKMERIKKEQPFIVQRLYKSTKQLMGYAMALAPDDCKDLYNPQNVIGRLFPMPSGFPVLPEIRDVIEGVYWDNVKTTLYPNGLTSLTREQLLEQMKRGNTPIQETIEATVENRERRFVLGDMTADIVDMMEE